VNGRARDDGERARRLMMAALDGELSGAEHDELRELLAADAGLRREFERLQRVKEVTSTMEMRQPPEEVWDPYWTSVYNKAERGVGWILVSIGAIILAGYGLWHAAEAIVADTNLPGFVKIALFGLFLGVAVLLVSVVREKLFTSRHDRYREVKR
jgi:hypothetical protein